MSNLPYAQASIPIEYQRHIVNYSREEAAGTIVVDTGNKFLYYVLPKGQAIRYGIRSGKMRKPGAASPPSAAKKNGRPGLRPPANTHGLAPYQPL
jgi:lipoprotein-anchoring transpeptidase ErfK/SrfK